MSVVTKWGAMALRGLGGVFAGVLLLFFFSLIVVLLALYSPSLSRILITEGIAYYDEMVPATIKIESMHGSIGYGLLLRGLTIYDANSFKLIEVEEIEFQLSFAELWRRSFDVEKIRVHSPHVFLPLPSDSGFADLLPPDDRPDIPTANIGPDLPLSIEFDLELNAIKIEQRSEAKPKAILHGGYLSILGMAYGKHAKIQMMMDGDFPSLDLQVDELVGEVEWTEPRMKIQELRLQSNAGHVQLVQANLQVAQTRQNAQLSAVLDREWLGQFVAAEQLPEQVHWSLDLTLDQQFDNLVNVRGARQLLRSESYIDLGADGRLKLSVAGKVDPQYDMDIKIDGEIVPTRWLPRVTEKQSWYVDAQVQGTSSDLNGMLTFVCPSCEENRLELRGLVDWQEERQQLSAKVDVGYADTHFQGDVKLKENQLRSADWKGSGTLLPWDRLSAWVVDPMTLEGKIETEGNCKKRSAQKGLDCNGTMKLSRFRWPEKGVQVDQVQSRIEYRGTPRDFFVDFNARSSRGPEGRLTAQVHLEEKLSRVALKTLEGKFQEYSLRLRQPAEISWGGEQFEVDRLKVKLNRSYLDAHGKVNLRGKNDFGIRLSHFDLGDLETWMPDVQLAGQLDLEMDLHGQWSAPEIAGKMGIQNLEWKSYRLSDAVNLAFSYQNNLAFADIRVRGRDGPSIQGQASLPIRIDPKKNRFEILADRELNGKLRFYQFDLKQLDLEKLATQASGSLGFDLRSLKPLEGVLGTEVDIQGSWSAPQARVKVTLEQLAWHQQSAGDLSIYMEYPEGWSQELSNKVNLGSESSGKTNYGALKVTINRNGHDWFYSRGTVPLAIDPAKARFSWYQRKPHELHVQVDPLELKHVSNWVKLGDFEGRAFADVHLRGDVEALSARAELRVKNARFDRGHVDSGTVYLNFDGRLDAPVLSTQVVLRDLGWDERGIADLHARASYQDEQLIAKLNAVPSFVLEEGLGSNQDGAPSLELQTNIPLAIDLRLARFNWKPNASHGIRLNFDNLDQRWLFAWSNTFSSNEHGQSSSKDSAATSNLELMLSGKFDLAGTSEVFNVAGALDGFVQHKQTGRSDISMQIQANQRAQRLDFRAGPRGPLALYAHVDSQAKIPELLVQKRKWGNVRFKGELEIKKLLIQPVEELLSTVISTPKGNIRANFQAEGTLDSPRLGGRVKMRDAQLVVVPLRQQFRNINLDLRLDDRKVLLQKFSAESGKKGRVELRGEIVAGQEVLEGQAQLKLHKLPFVRPGLPYTTINSVIRPRIRVSGQVTEVDIEIDKTRVNVLGTNVPAPRAIPSMDSIQYASRNVEKKKCPEKRRTRSSDKEVRVKINVQDPILITGPQIELRWVGNLGVVEKDGEIKIDGILQAKGGWVRFSGNKFDVVEGSVTLPSVGELDPYIRVLATTELPEAQVSILVQGRASEPELHLSSDPPMEEFQILSLLVTGSSEARDATDVNVQAEAAKLLAAFQNSALQQVLNQKLGIDRAELSFGETIDQPIVTTGKRITRDLYVESQYHHNAPADRNEAQVNVEYRFAPHWMIESFFGDAAAGGLDLYWFRRFGGPSKKPSTREKNDAHNKVGFSQPNRNQPGSTPDQIFRQKDCISDFDE